VVAAASFDCGAHEVSVLPTTNEALTGNFTVYYVAWVYDEATGGWRSAPSWTVADGITAQTFDDITTPDATGYIEYGHMDNGTWVTTWDTVTISDGIDDAPPFC